MEWNIRSQIVSADVVAARCEAFAESTPDATDVLLPDVSPELVELAEHLQLRPVELGGNQVYRLERSDMIAQMVVRIVDGRPKTVALAAAFRAGSEWQFFELAPSAATPDYTASDEHLLPLPVGAQRDGGRFADNGRPLLELISLESTSAELVAAWQDAGWEVRPSGLGEPGGFSYLCARGDRVVYAWSADPPTALRTLMLVDTPEAADTSVHLP
jgi:hypothetical protein